MIIINAKQGSDAWKAHRKTTHNASDYPVAQGLSKNRKRSKLIIEAATGIEQEFSDYQEKILANGHRVEELARPMAEAIIGEELYQVVATSDDGYLGASSDGATMCYDIGFECKQWNNELAASVEQGIVPQTHVGQLDQQTEVFGFEKILFMVTDGTPENCVFCWHVSSPEALAAIRPTWAQFDEDVANYQPEVIEAKPILTANPIDNLPALVIEVTGRVTHSNLVEFKAAATAVISSIKTELVTDQDFVDATNAVKYLKDVEDNAKRAKQNALDQTTSIAELHRALDEVAKMAGDVRKALDKKISEEKDSRKAEIVTKASQELVNHIMALNERLGVAYMPRITAPFGEAIKGLKSLDSMREKVSVALANAKIEANAAADLIDYNIKTLTAEGKDWRFLFPDLASVVTKAKDDFTALLMSRVAQHKEAEGKRLEAEREKIRAEEQEKAEKAAAEKAAAEKAAAEALARQNAEVVANNQTQFEAPEAKPEVGSWIPESLAPEPAAVCVQETSKSETQPILSVASETQAAVNACLTTIKLGEICARLGFTVTADFLASLGVSPVATDKNAKLYDANKFPTICRLISEHVMALAFKKAA
jgi:predicted phage-related endonuclease